MKTKKLTAITLVLGIFAANCSVQADQKLLEHINENLKPIMRNDVDSDRMTKESPFCKSFQETKVIATWLTSAFVLYTFNTYGALQASGSVKDCSQVDAYSKRSEGASAAFVTKEQRHKVATDLFVTTCFNNGKELQKKLYEGARKAASAMTCQSYGDLSSEILTTVRNFNF